MELFLHPWYMVAGGALISSPIIIHLINRMRFKRIRWAAMEFLLKSQKRNRRRLIIEQMILLLLRILLVLLIGFLVARYVGGALGSTGQGTMHVVVLDDTPSMGDHWKDQGNTRTALEVGKDQIKQLARTAGQASSSQAIQVYKLSDLTKPLYNDRISDRTEQELSTKLSDLKPTALHIDPVKAIEKSRDVFNSVSHGQKILHLVSDFRENDWGTSDKLEELNEQINKLTDAGINLNLLDTAHPFRKDTKGVVLHHDNLAIEDFKSDSRIAAEGMPVEFTVSVMNYSTKEVTDCFLKVRVDGKEEFAASQPIEKLVGSGKTDIKFQLLFTKKQPTPEFVHISAELVEKDPSGLLADNIRDLVIELRKKVPILVIDGEGEKNKRERGSDSFDLDGVLYTEKSVLAEIKGVEFLEQANIEDYPCIFLLNVGQIKNEALLKRLQEYVKNGGSLAFFMGEKINTSFYNETLHKQYDGLFPVMISGRPTDPVTPEERLKRKLEDPQPKILFRDANHPIVQGELAGNAGAFQYLSIDRYYPTLPRSQWNPTSEKEKAQEIITLPNRNDIKSYSGRAQELLRQAVEKTRELAEADKSYDKYTRPVENYQRAVGRALDLGRDTNTLYFTILELDRLLKDQGEPNKPDRPNMTELWSHPSMGVLKNSIEAFREGIQFGDPLVVVRPYGRGKVAACLTTAGVKSNWNDWAEGPLSWSYVIFFKKLLRNLNSESADLNRVATDAAGIKLQFDETQYKDTVKFRFQAQPDPEAKKGGAAAGEPPDPEKQTLRMATRKVGDNQFLVLDYNDAVRPGVYTFEFEPNDPRKASSETRSYAFNVDTRTESDLKRASQTQLVEYRKKKTEEARSGKIALSGPGEEITLFKARDPDISESPWLYLLFLIILVIEQALAVHLSFHVSPSDAAAPARTSRPAPAAA